MRESSEQEERFRGLERLRSPGVAEATGRGDFLFDFMITLTRFEVKAIVH